MKFLTLFTLLFLLIVSTQSYPHRMHKISTKVAKMRLKHKLKQIFSQISFVRPGYIESGRVVQVSPYSPIGNRPSDQWVGAIGILGRFNQKRKSHHKQEFLTRIDTSRGDSCGFGSVDVGITKNTNPHNGNFGNFLQTPLEASESYSRPGLVRRMLRRQ